MAIAMVVSFQKRRKVALDKQETDVSYKPVGLRKVMPKKQETHLWHQAQIPVAFLVFEATDVGVLHRDHVYAADSAGKTRRRTQGSSTRQEVWMHRRDLSLSLIV